MEQYSHSIATLQLRAISKQPEWETEKSPSIPNEVINVINNVTRRREDSSDGLVLEILEDNRPVSAVKLTVTLVRTWEVGEVSFNWSRSYQFTRKGQNSERNQYD